MRVISFAHTTPALLAGAKRRTRRDWKDATAAGFARDFKVGALVQAYDRSPRLGGRCVALVELTAPPRFTSDLDGDDWSLEGFAWLDARGIRLPGVLKAGPALPAEVWAEWQRLRAAQDFWKWLVEFRVADLTDRGRELKAAL